MAVRKINDIDLVAPETAGVKKKIAMQKNDGGRDENGGQPFMPLGIVICRRDRHAVAKFGRRFDEIMPGSGQN